MKTRIYADDGQPESWDCNDNYFELDEPEARGLVLRWANRFRRSRDRARAEQQDATSMACTDLDEARGATRMPA